MFSEAARVADPRYPATIFYAYKARESSDDGINAPGQPSISLTPMARSHGAMIVVGLLLAAGAILSLACFVYQFYLRWEYGERGM